MKGLIKGAIGATIIVIGGATYSFTQEDVVKNMSVDTGMTEQQTEQWIDDSKDYNGSWTEIGNDYVTIGKELAEVASSDCDEWEFEWESPTLTCQEGLRQIDIISDSTLALGNSYIKLDSNSASETDMLNTINLIGRYNSNLAFEIVTSILTEYEIGEETRVNAYNKAVLKSALED